MLQLSKEVSTSMCISAKEIGLEASTSNIQEAVTTPTASSGI